MNQSFRWKYNEIQDGNPTSKNVLQDEFYPSESHVREVCFVLADGFRQSFNYGDKITHDYSPEEGRIILFFASHTVTLTGIYFEKLFYDLMQHLPRQIVCKDARYNPTNEKDKPVVNEIIIHEK